MVKINLKKEINKLKRERQKLKEYKKQVLSYNKLISFKVSGKEDILIKKHAIKRKMYLSEFIRYCVLKETKKDDRT